MKMMIKRNNKRIFSIVFSAFYIWSCNTTIKSNSSQSVSMWLIEKRFPLWVALNLLLLMSVIFALRMHSIVCRPLTVGEKQPNLYYFFKLFSSLCSIILNFSSNKGMHWNSDQSIVWNLFDFWSFFLNISTSNSLSDKFNILPISLVMISHCPLTYWTYLLR